MPLVPCETQSIANAILNNSRRVTFAEFEHAVKEKTPHTSSADFSFSLIRLLVATAVFGCAWSVVVFVVRSTGITYQSDVGIDDPAVAMFIVGALFAAACGGIAMLVSVSDFLWTIRCIVAPAAGLAGGLCLATLLLGVLKPQSDYVIYALMAGGGLVSALAGWLLAYGVQSFATKLIRHWRCS